MHNKQKFLRLIAVSAIAFAILATGCTGSQQRKIKNIESNWTGGLDRTVTVYDYNGKPIKSWSGKIDIAKSENETDFIVNDKRIIVHGGITIIEEK